MRLLALCAAAVVAAGTLPAPAAATADGPKDSPRYRFPIEKCLARYSRTHHDYPAADVFARSGCVVVSVTEGVVDEVSRKDTWSAAKNRGATRGGLSVSIVGDDGVRYYYSHLASVGQFLAPGRRVATGERIGRVGTTGSARGTAPHLHFGISWPTEAGVWWVRRGAVAPAPYLDAWRRGRDRSPAKAVAQERTKQGEVPRCEALC
ncbi:MAG: M23 family metallopeptidase [Sporichthyaceae bacterium]